MSEPLSWLQADAATVGEPQFITVKGRVVPIGAKGASAGARGRAGSMTPVTTGVAGAGVRPKETPEQLEARRKRVMGKLPTVRKALPTLRKTVAADLKRSDAQRERVGAVVARIMDVTTMRVGSERYATKTARGESGQDSYGASSLRKSHVEVEGNTVRFTFPGKSRKAWQREIEDAGLAKAVKHLLTLPGDRLMQYHGTPKSLKPFDEDEARRYLAPHGITPKNLRTFHATRMASEMLREAGPPGSAAEARRTIREVVERVSEHLGNTPAICRSNYINPVVLEAYARQAVRRAAADAAEDDAFGDYLDRLDDLLREGQLTGADPFPEDREDAPDDEDGEETDMSTAATADGMARAKSIEDLDRAAMRTDPYPDLLQREANTYRKGSVNVQGFIVAIENPRGSWRSGTNRHGEHWSTELKNHYGYIRRTEGADSDEVDVFLGPDPTSERVFVIDQIDPESGRFDEHKVVLGAQDEYEARTIYLANYQSGWQGLGAITEMSVGEFREWLKGGDQSAPVSELVAAGDALDWEEECLADGLDCQILMGDAGPGGLLRVRQRAMRADAKNRNRRVYPRQVVQAAIDACRIRARAGAMLSDMVHPRVARLDDGEHFVDQPDRKTARVDDVTDVGSDGWVYVDRTILDTEHGRRVADRIRSRSPLGISTRFKMRGKRVQMNGDSVHVAEAMEIHTWDDVDNPAVDGAGEFELLTDSVLAELVAAGDGSSIVACAGTPEEEFAMNETFKRTRSRLYEALATRASGEDVQKLRQALSDEIRRAGAAGEDVTAMAQAVMAVDKDMESAGFHSDRPAPTVTPAKRSASPDDPGYAPDTAVGAEGDALTADEMKSLREKLAAERQAQADRERTQAIQAAVDAQREVALKDLPADQRDTIAALIARTARSADDVPQLVADHVESLGKLIAKERLAAKGMSGQTVSDPATPGNANLRIEIKSEASPWGAAVDKLCAASDDWAKRASGVDLTPDDLKRRAYNRKAFIEPLIDQYRERFTNVKTLEQWMNATDSEGDDLDKAVCDAITEAAAKTDATTLSNVYNQPSISIALLVQSYQDMKALQFVEGIGPGLENPALGPGGWRPLPSNDGRIGSVIRIPVEYYAEASGAGVFAGPQYDAGMLVAENAPIPESTVTVNWLEFGAFWRRGAFGITSDALRAMANGPLNYNMVGRHLYHLGQDRSRRIDKALFDELLDASDQYLAVQNSAETANSTNNTVYNGSGSVICNLNPTKLADAAVVAASDQAVQYGANVVGAVRLKGPGNATSSPYFGTTKGGTLAVKPYRKPTLSAAGQLSTSTLFAITVSAPASMVEGYLDATGAIQDLPGGGTATYAVDHENGVIVFKTGAVTNGGAGTKITTVVTVTYYYAVNYDEFYARTTDNAAASLLATGVTRAEYFNELLEQFDLTGATMGARPRFQKPNIAIMSETAATFITRATAFYQLNSPEQTALYPTPDFFATRNSINMARHNSPWRAGDRSILLGRRGATKYAVDTPWEIVGPVQAYDQATAQVVAQQKFYGQENSAIFTPQVTKTDGTILNPFYRRIMLR